MQDGPSPDAPWTSTLSPADLLLLRRTGFEPLGAVAGISVYRFGTQVSRRALSYQPRYGVTGRRALASIAPHPQNASVRLPSAYSDGYRETYDCQHVGSGHVPGVNYEDLRLATAVTEAFEAARDRLREDARRLGAHGVIASYVTVERTVGSRAPAVEVRILGTAVHAPGDALPQPFTSHLTTSEFAKLLRSGRVPVDIACGVGVVHSYFGCVGGPQDPWGRGEFTQRADARQICRELAIDRVTSSVASNELVVGVHEVPTFTEGPAVERAFEHVVVGTATMRFADLTIEPPALTVDLGRSAS